ncbi:DNA sulfur modification protein DndB [Psychromonas sp. SP041]|uniref:DNA sulfur modification protein DndB n=1 Tax=Psychromonas sp. SP041 TaxID=1365007 RepID=UPI000405CBD6|nr:DNA sulfur modification protein DndB [Psychromonas sp. SP041]
MNNSNESRIMTSPIKKDLQLTLFKAQEGIMNLYPDIEVCEGIITTQELIEHFLVEQNADVIDEKYKMQRDVDKSRVNGHIDYVREGNTIYPSLTIFVNKLDIQEETTIGNRVVYIANLLSGSDRFLCDGQGRYSGNKHVYSEMESMGDFNEMLRLGNQTFGFKVIITNSDTIYCKKEIVRTVFSDYHLNLKKPSTSLSLYFDGKTPYSKLMRSLIETTELAGKPLEKWISLNGTLKLGQMWKLDQFAKFIHTAMDKTKGQFNKDLKEQEVYDEVLSVLQVILPKALNNLPVNVLTEDTEGSPNVPHDATLFGAALFSEGLGYLVRSIIDRSFITGKLEISKLDALANLPLDNLYDKEWLKADIIMPNPNAASSARAKEFIIVKHSAKRIGSHLCEMLDVYPCKALRA